VHDLVVETRRDRAGRLRFRTLLEAHHHLDFGAKGFPVTFDSFFAVPIEEEVRLNGSVVFCRGHRLVCYLVLLRLCLVTTCKRFRLDFQHSFFKAKAVKPPVELAPTAVNSAVVMQAGHMVGFVSVHPLQRTRSDVLDTFVQRLNIAGAFESGNEIGAAP
jgi:hypothetical protein